MSLVYLWKNREQPKILTKRWVKVVAKRIWNIPELMKITLRRFRYAAKGLSAGQLTVFGELDFNGPPSHLTIGERSFISEGVHLALHDQITIGNRVVINSKVQLLTASHHTDDPLWQQFKKPIVIEDYAWIANSAIILPGVRIGKGAVVGAGAVVSKNVPDYAIAVGNPAKLIKNNRAFNLNYSPVDLIACYEAWLGRGV